MKSPSFPVESYEFTLSNKNQSVFVLHRDFPCSMPALQNLTHQPAEAPFWEHSGRFTLRPRYQLSTIVTLDHLYFTSDVFQVILLYMVRVWDWWQSAKSVFLLSAINQAKFTKIHASQATKSPCSKHCAVDLKDGCKLREQGLSIVLAQNLEKAHLPKTMKCPSFPVESYELWVYFEQQKSVRVCSA